MRIAIAVFAVVWSIPLSADSVRVVAGGGAARVFDYAALRHSVATAFYSSAEWKGFSATSTTHYDTRGIVGAGFDVQFSHRVKIYTVLVDYSYYRFRGSADRDHVWSVTVERVLFGK